MLRSYGGDWQDGRVLLHDQPLPSQLHIRDAVPPGVAPSLALGVHECDLEIPIADGCRVIEDPHGGLPEGAPGRSDKLPISAVERTRKRFLQETQQASPRVQRGECGATRRPTVINLDARDWMLELGLSGRDIGPSNGVSSIRVAQVLITVREGVPCKRWKAMSQALREAIACPFAQRSAAPGH